MYDWCSHSLYQRHLIDSLEPKDSPNSVPSGMEEKHSQPFAAIPNDILLEIFRLLTCEVLGRISIVCKQWKSLAEAPALWRSACLISWPLFEKVDVEDPFIWKDLYCRVRLAEQGMKAQESKASRSGERTYPSAANLIASASEASSTDNREDDISNTVRYLRRAPLYRTPSLSTAPPIVGLPPYWFSAGSEEQESLEYLEYNLTSPLTFISSFSLAPARTNSHFGSPVYAPRMARLMVSTDKSGSGYESLDDYDCGPEFFSEFHRVKRTEDLQRFSVGAVVVGRTARLSLLGSTQRGGPLPLWHTNPGLWHTAIRQVAIHGYDLLAGAYRCRERGGRLHLSRLAPRKRKSAVTDVCNEARADARQELEHELCEVAGSKQKP